MGVVSCPVRSIPYNRRYRQWRVMPPAGLRPTTNALVTSTDLNLHRRVLQHLSDQGTDACLRCMLDLNELGDCLPAITASFGKALAEAAGVCLESQGHSLLTQITIRGHISIRYPVAWPQVTEQTRRTWNDPEEATEYGATGIAVLLARQELGYLVIERSVKGTGIDYWMGDESDALSFERKARLEISGIRSGSSSAVRDRVRQKLQQTTPSDGSLPAFVIVVEFGTPLAEVQMK